MKNIFSVFFSYVHFWLLFIFKNEPNTKIQHIAFSTFRSTYRVPESDRSSVWIVLRYFLRAILTVLTPKNNKCFVRSNDEHTYIYDLFRNDYSFRKKYIEFFKGEGVISGGIFKSDSYYCDSFLQGFILIVLLTLWTPFLFFYSFFQKDKAPYAIIYREIFEIINLLNLCHHLNVKVLYYFCIYEKDSNLIAYLLQKERIIVNKITSDSPLSYWNKVIVADNIYLCSGYQLDEISHFESTLYSTNIELWAPEKFLKNKYKYDNPVEISEKTIGFYSTGGWVRKLENHKLKTIDVESMENKVMNIIKKICILNPEYQLIIFLHPREKWEKYIKLANDRYTDIFKGVNFKIIKEDSVMSFEKASLGIAFSSTIVFERLYYGFKTILMPIGLENNFPVKDSNIKNICAYTEDELFSKIQENIKYSNIDFFDKNRIKHYANYLYN